MCHTSVHNLATQVEPGVAELRQTMSAQLAEAVSTVKLGTDLRELLHGSAAKPRLLRVAEALADACAKIAGVLRGGAEAGAGTQAVGTENAFGDAQLEVDLRTDDIIVECLKACRAVATVSSEENPVEQAIDHDVGEEVYSVAFDPLDGSSIVDANWAVGTIVRWEGKALVRG